MTIPISRLLVPRTRGVRSQGGAKSSMLSHAGSGGYAGASTSTRALRTWVPSARSADADTVPDLKTLRSRSRDLVRNAPIAGGAINGLSTNVVGTGLTLQAAIDRDTLGLTPEQATKWQARAEQIWNHWARRSDIRRKHQFKQLQDIIFRSVLESGDLLVIRRRQMLPGDLLGLKLQLVEADRVSTPDNKLGDPNIVDGVKLNKDGAAVSYFVSNRYPESGMGERDWINQLTRKWVQVMALGAASRKRQVLHIGELSRPGQTRGVPYLSSVIEPIKQLERYTEAEIAAAVIASYFTVFTKTEAAEGLANTTIDPNAVELGTVNSKTNDLELGPGMINDLMPGEDIEIADPKRPNSNFDPFVQAVLVQIGMRLEIPLEVLTKQFKASYSAARAAMLEARRFYAKRRAWLTIDLCEPVYEWVIEEAILRGFIDAQRQGDISLSVQVFNPCGQALI